MAVTLALQLTAQLLSLMIYSINYVCEYTHCNASVEHFFVVWKTFLLLVLWHTRYPHFQIAELGVIVIRKIVKTFKIYEK